MHHESMRGGKRVPQSVAVPVSSAMPMRGEKWAHQSVAVPGASVMSMSASQVKTAPLRGNHVQNRRKALTSRSKSCFQVVAYFTILCATHTPMSWGCTDCDDGEYCTQDLLVGCTCEVSIPRIPKCFRRQSIQPYTHRHHENATITL